MEKLKKVYETPIFFIHGKSIISCFIEIIKSGNRHTLICRRFDVAMIKHEPNILIQKIFKTVQGLFDCPLPSVDFLVDKRLFQGGKQTGALVPCRGYSKGERFFLAM